MPQNQLRSISEISVELLFGMYSYVLDMSAKENAEDEKIAILYGDNGSGKSTLLRLAFHMIAPDPGMGHKTFLLNTDFKELVVKFNDGTVVKAERNEGGISGPYLLSVKRGRKKPITAKISTRKSDKNDELHTVIEPALQELGCSLYLLSDDRAIHHAGGGSKSKIRASKSRHFVDEFQVDSELNFLRREPPESPEDIAKQLLRLAIERTEEWFKRGVIGSSTRGDSGVNELYANILKRISDTGGDKAKNYSVHDKN